LTNADSQPTEAAMLADLTDLVLAIAHHLLIFAILAVLVMELTIVRPEMSTAQILRVGRLDMAYGILAIAIVVIGFGRVFFGAKPWDFYIYNWVFWAKIAAFATVGVLSVQPTIRLARWRAAALRDPTFRPPVAEVTSVRQFMHYEASVFILIPIFAAMMARGVGL
jgi:putative membrane protein